MGLTVIPGANASGSKSFRLVNATTTTTSVPSGASAGIPVPTAPSQSMRVHLELKVSTTSGDRDARAKVFGYRPKLHTISGGIPAPVASSAFWTELFDTGEITGEGADFNRSFRLENVTDYQRVAVQILTVPPAGTKAVTAAIAFSGQVDG